MALPSRLLLGPGPSMVHPRVLQVMAVPLVGHLDPAFLDLMTSVQHRLRWLFRTHNTFTIAVSGTGSAGMEAVLVNLIEPGDRVLVGVNGVFGSRMATIVERCGGQLVTVHAPWGHIIQPDAIEQLLVRHGGIKIVALVHAETSTGVRQPLEDMGALCRRHGALLVVDAVTSLGGIPVETDQWGIDACYSGTQKCLSCPPGLSPVTLSNHALDAIRQRKTRCQSWYFDFLLIADYWAASKRAYHHTAPITMLYALHEALQLIEEEGLEARWARHECHSAALIAGLEALGFRPFPHDGSRLPTLHCVTLPPGIDDGLVRRTLLEQFGIEVGGGLGELQGKAWRIGLMGHSSSEANVLALLHALERIFSEQRRLARAGIALQAAADRYTTMRCPVT